MEKIPLVSVIIPMYNSAKFIPQTLESLLYQTMKDFEVVVVDDCSTDNSVEVVENFKPRFASENVKLHVIKLPKNTGTPGLPRNAGIKAAHGKYIALLDSDDLYTKTALEEITKLAENYEVDVLHLGANFVLWEGEWVAVETFEMTDFYELTNPKNFSLKIRYNKLPEKPILEPNNIEERIKKWITLKDGSWTTWLLFYRREFLLDNQIFFSAMPTFEDAPFAFEAVCLSKNYLIAPNVVNIIRPRENSISRDTNKIPLKTHFHKRIDALKMAFHEFERIMEIIPFFANHPDYRYKLLEWIGKRRMPVFKKRYNEKNPVHELYEIIRSEFNSPDASLIAYFFNTVNLYMKQIELLKKENAERMQQISTLKEDIDHTKNLYRTLAFCTRKLNEVQAENNALQKKLGKK